MQTPLGDRLYRTVTTVCAAAIPLVLVLLTAVVMAIIGALDARHP